MMCNIPNKANVDTKWAVDEAFMRGSLTLTLTQRMTHRLREMMMETLRAKPLDAAGRPARVEMLAHSSNRCQATSLKQEIKSREGLDLSPGSQQAGAVSTVKRGKTNDYGNQCTMWMNQSLEIKYESGRFIVLLMVVEKESLMNFILKDSFHQCFTGCSME